MRDLIILGIVATLFALMVAWQQADTREWRKENRELLAENKELRRYVAILSKHPTGVNRLIQGALDETLQSIGSLLGIDTEPLPYARRRADDED